MDAGKYYALLRFAEASTGLRAALELNLVDELGDQTVSMSELQERFGFTMQATRTYLSLLEVMEVVQRSGDKVRVADRARACLSQNASTSRRPYLEMGGGEDVQQFIALLRGELPSGSIPLYGDGKTNQTLMDVPEAAREIAFGLASRARNFAEPLAAAIKPYAGKASILADIGAGSPYVADACLNAVPHLSKVVLVDRENGMQYAKEMADAATMNVAKMEFREHDFFRSIPPADFYCISNTAHDWLPEEYGSIMLNVRDSIAPRGVVCVHEPLLASTWNSAEDWVHALWMACYAVTLFRLTEGKGTCYTQEEHDLVMSQNGFVRTGEPVRTMDGCTALFYQLESEVPSGGEQAAAVQPRAATR